MANLGVEFAGVKFKNPVLVGSGEPTMRIENIRRCIEAGAGGLVVKSVSNSADMRVMFSSQRVLNEKHRVARGKVPRLIALYARGAVGNHVLEDWLPIL